SQQHGGNWARARTGSGFRLRAVPRGLGVRTIRRSKTGIEGPSSCDHARILPRRNWRGDAAEEIICRPCVSEVGEYIQKQGEPIMSIGALTDQPPKQPPADCTAHFVDLMVDKGNFTYKPTMLRVKQGDKVTFRYDGPSFEIMFKERSPGELFRWNEDATLT